MQIILMEKVVNLGGLGDVVKVKDGYARNFLIPHGKAKRATEANLKEFEGRRAELEKKAADRSPPPRSAPRSSRASKVADHPQGGRRRPALRLGHQRRHRRGARSPGHRGREGRDPHAPGAAQAHRRVPAHRRSCTPTCSPTSPSRCWASSNPLRRVVTAGRLRAARFLFVPSSGYQVGRLAPFPGTGELHAHLVHRLFR